MIRETTLYASGQPAPQPRPRFSRGKKSKFVRTYNPPSADEWKTSVRAAWAEARQEPFLRGLKISLRFVIARPAYHWNSKGRLTVSAPAEIIGKPDVDNLAKSTLDALENAGAYHDDCAILSLSISKRYAARDEVAGCRITIAEIDA